MAGVSISDVGLLFTRYLSGVVETLNHSSKARNLVRKQDKWTGDHIEGRVHVQRTGAVQATEDGGDFPVADKQDYAAWKAYRKFVVGSIQLTDGVMATAAKSKNVAVDVISSEVKGLMREILKWENGMFFRDGTGAVAQFVESDPSSQTTTEVDDARMLWEGVNYDIYDNASLSSSPTKHGTCTISSITEAPTASDNFTITVSSALPAGLAYGTSGDYLVWKNSVNRAPTGLESLIDDTSTTFQNINTATYPHYKSLVLANSGTLRDLTPSLFRQMLAGLYQKSGNERPASGLTVLTNSYQAINVEELYEGELRLTPESKVGGLAVAAFQSALGRIDILVDSDALYHKMFFCDFDKIYRAVQKPLSWRRQGGSIFLRSDTAGVWTATAMEICEYYIKERHTSGRIDDLNEDPATAY
jgi:hypothetical protein